MSKKEIIAMILAGGQGSRLGVLTKELAKPAIPFAHHIPPYLFLLHLLI